MHNNIKNYLGIDPGLSGGICVLTISDWPIACKTWRMPVVSQKIGKSTKNRIDVAALNDILDSLKFLGVDMACIEDLSGRPGVLFRETAAGRQAVPQKGQWQQGYNSGLIIGAIVALGIPHIKIQPAIWKRTLRVVSDKNSSLIKAGELFPEFSAQWGRHDGQAEAALLAYYCYVQMGRGA